MELEQDGFTKRHVESRFADELKGVAIAREFLPGAGLGLRLPFNDQLNSLARVDDAFDAVR